MFIFLLFSICFCFFISVFFALEHVEDRKLVEFFAFQWFFIQFPIFCLGLFAAFLNNWLKNILNFNWRTSISFALTFGGVAIFLLIPTSNIYLYPSSISLVPILMGLSLRDWKLFVNRFTVFIGKISYSIYLIHFFVLALIEPSFKDFRSILIASGIDDKTLHLGILTSVLLFLTLPIAYATWRFIENPFIQLGRQFIQSLEKNK